MKLTILYGDETFMMEVGQGDSLTQVMTTLEGLTGLTSARQILIANSQKLDPRLTVSGSGLQDGDLVVVEQSTAPHVPAASAREGWTAEAQLADLFERCRSNPQLLQRAPRSIHDAVQSNNFNAFVEHVRQWKAEEEMQKADPFDPEAQARIAEYIRSKNVEENMQIAFDECPEAFSDVIMLYVNLEVNNHAIKAFVDSGAQRTIMSHECAGRCNILHLLDTRFAGIARGVGQGKILGRVHAVQMKVGDRYLPVSITVLESNDVDFLFGLDMLRRYQCSIDLLSNVLRFPSINLELPFLSEHELPTHARLFLPGEEASASAGANPGGATGGQGLGWENSATMLSPAEAAARAAQARAAAAAPIEPTSLQQGTSAGGPSSSGAVDKTGMGQGVGTKAMVERLMAFGFSEKECLAALQKSNGNEDLAASLLFE
eukprot:jgi/Botrbrau1/10242/Bobra.0140s0001.2